MKIQKKMIVFCAGAMLALSVCSGSAIAASCLSANIVQAGVRPDIAVPGTVSKFRVKLTCDNTDRWSGERFFYLSEELGEAGFATVLTAKSLGKQVIVSMESYDWNSLITIIELTDNDATP